MLSLSLPEYWLMLHLDAKDIWKQQKTDNFSLIPGCEHAFCRLICVGK